MEMVNMATEQPAVQSANAQTQPDQPALVQPKPPKNGKLPKIKHGPNSFRPGATVQNAAPATVAKPIGLYFTVPASAVLGNPDEATKVQHIAAQLSADPGLGAVNAFGIRNGAWEISLLLVPQGDTRSDKFLSDVFRALDPTIKQLPELSNGFTNVRGAKSAWEYRIGAAVLDKGGF